MALNEYDQAQLIDYLYGNMSPEQRQVFERRLFAEPDLKLAMEQQQELSSLHASGVQPAVEQRRLDAVNWNLQKALRQQSQHNQTLFGKLAEVWNHQVTFKAQFASVLVAFAVGFVIANYQSKSELQLMAAQHQQAQPIEFIQNDDFEITDLQLDAVDPTTGKVRVNYSLASQTQVDGNLGNQDIQQLLAATMKDEVNDSVRLDLVELLKDYTNSKQVREALEHSLLNDPNPGVRMVAAESLAKLANSQSVREVLRQALAGDINPGVRVEAFDALIEHLDDQETIEILKAHGPSDSNPYIRNQTERLIQEIEQKNNITNI